jgi:hypothetical protein
VVKTYLGGDVVDAHLDDDLLGKLRSVLSGEAWRAYTTLIQLRTEGCDEVDFSALARQSGMKPHRLLTVVIPTLVQYGLVNFEVETDEADESAVR